MRVLTVLALGIFTASVFAAPPSPVGVWKGSLQVDVPADMKSKMPVAPKTSIEVNLKANNTYTGKQSGTPDGKVHTVEGTWKLSGAKVLLQPVKRDGKAVSGQGATARTYVMSKDGKTMTQDLTSQLVQGARTPDGKKVDTSKFKIRIVLKKV